MSACQPTVEGVVERDGVAVHYERYGEGEPAILLRPTWSLLTSCRWKMHVAYLSRHFTVVSFDGRGNGRSSRPAKPAAYTDVAFAKDALAVMDATAGRMPGSGAPRPRCVAWPRGQFADRVAP